MSTPLSLLSSGTATVLPAGELEAKLALDRPLRVKAGFDPTAPDLHLGHAVLLTALRRFQDAGHTVVLVIGDFTARIGDPTGKNATRPPLSSKSIAENAATYTAQAFTVLDPERTEVRFNSEWLDLMSAAELIQLAAQQTVARLLERDDFAKRFSAHTPIAVHEFIYPLLQGYDSVAIAADVEVGGTDQTFNLLMGRALQEHAGQKPQVVITLPLLEGLDGTQKMSKSLGNQVGLTDTPVEMVTKIMSVDDEAMWRWFALLSRESGTTLAQWRTEVYKGQLHPREAKLRLAKEIVERFHGLEAAEQAIKGWEAVVGRKTDISTLPVTDVCIPQEGVPLITLLVSLGLALSRTEARQKIGEGAVWTGGVRAETPMSIMMPGFEGLIQVGKRRFVHVHLVNEA